MEFIERKKHIIIIVAMILVMLYLFDIYTKSSFSEYGKWIAVLCLLISGIMFWYYYIKRKPQQRSRSYTRMFSIPPTEIEVPNVPTKPDVFKEFDNLK